MTLLRVSLLGFVVLLLGACSSSNGSHDRGSNETVLTGQFIDSAVSGVRYTTETRSGVTDSAGTFEYLEGETVHFYLGELSLGDAHGAATVSLFDLVDGVTPVVGNALKKAVWEWRQGPGFHTVINLATLLQTLDSDGNPGNGIAISPDVAALFKANSVNFDQHWQEFNYDPGFNQALAEAKAKSLLDDARQKRKPWLALAHLYASLGIDNGVRVSSGDSTDTDDDGTPDVTSHFQFDANGVLMRIDRDRDADGTPDEAIVYSYDSDGNLIMDAQDYDGDGTPDYTAAYHYDAAGNQIGRDVDLDGDGETDETATYSYDANGNRTHESSDTDGDGLPDRLAEFTYDADGNLIHAAQDDDADGTPDRTNTYTYDAQGNRTRSEQDDDGEGTPDIIESYTYDANGNVLVADYDNDGDGSPDSTTTSAYDANGDLTRYAYDFDGDGDEDYVGTIAYDANRNIVREEIDDDADGVPNSIETRVYDEDGNLLRTEYDNDADGDADSITTVEYDPDADSWWSIFNPPTVTFRLVFSGPSSSSSSSSGSVWVLVTSPTAAP